MPRLRMVLFDWNGTTQNDLWILFEGIRVLFAEHGQPVPSIETYRAVHHHDWQEFYRQFGLSHLSREYLYQRLWLDMKHLHSRAELHPHFRELLAFLDEALLLRGIVSGEHDEFLADALVRHDLVHCWDVVEVGKTLDKRNAICRIIRKNTFRAGEVVYIDDSIKGLTDGKAAGALTIAIGHGYGTLDRLQEAEPDFTANSFVEVEQILRELAVNGKS